MTRALRVLHIASGDLWAGAEVQAFTLIMHLTRIPNTEVAAVLMNEGVLACKLRSAGVPVYVVDERKMASPWILGRLCRIISTWRPDVIHTHREKENILGSVASRLCRRVPSVRTIHGGREDSEVRGWKGTRRRAIRAFDRWCGRALQHRLIAVTRELSVRMQGELPAEKIVVIENGVDAAAVRAEKGIAQFRTQEPGAAHVGIVGRLVPVKRVDLFLETAAALLRHVPERSWRFHVFGDGPERSRLEGLAEGLGISGRVTFHGHRQDSATCIGGLDALVICSDHEGLPMTALEAAALAVPTVAHAVGGLVEVVPDEFLVPRHEVTGYRDGVLCALHADSRVIAENHATIVLQRFSAQRNAERVHALYEHVTAQGPSGAGRGVEEES